MGETIQQLIELLSEHSQDTSTLMELHRMLYADCTSWGPAYELFLRIRQKKLQAGAKRDLVLVTQYDFEEAIAKMLYNCSGGPGPFDPHAPYWIVPMALAWAQLSGIAPEKVVRIVAPVQAPAPDTSPSPDA